jgi:hypothetical protein
MNTTLATLGIVFLGAAAVGGGLKALGIEFQPLASGRRQLLLAAVGVVALVAAFVAPRLNTSTQPSSQRPPSTPAVQSGTSQSTSPAPPTSNTILAAGTRLFHKTGVQLTSGYALSISDRNLIPIQNNGCAGDLWICGSTDIGSSAQLALYSGTPQPAGFSQCQSDTAYAPVTGVLPAQSLVGTTLCVTTTDRIAVCYVTGDTRWGTGPTNGLTMDVTVYSLH